MRSKLAKRIRRELGDQLLARQLRRILRRQRAGWSPTTCDVHYDLRLSFLRRLAAWEQQQAAGG
jgi:hypothetical protein